MIELLEGLQVNQVVQPITERKRLKRSVKLEVAIAYLRKHPDDIRLSSRKLANNGMDISHTFWNKAKKEV